MRDLPKEKFKVLAAMYDWSLDYAKGYVDGEISRLRGRKASEHALIGIDEYCLGFRTGYFDRQNPNSTRAGSRDTAERFPPLVQSA